MKGVRGILSQLLKPSTLNPKHLFVSMLGVLFDKRAGPAARCGARGSQSQKGGKEGYLRFRGLGVWGSRGLGILGVWGFGGVLGV